MRSRPALSSPRAEAWPSGGASDPTGRGDPRGVDQALDELRRTTGADAGVALYLPDHDGDLTLFAALGTGALLETPHRRRAFGLARSEPRAGALALLPVPERAGGLAVLARRGTRPFSDEDRAVARLLLRRLVVDAVPPDLTGGTAILVRQLEAIHRIGARLVRLASLEEVGQAVCTETRQVIDYHNCRVYVVDERGEELVPVAWRGDLGRYDGETGEALRCRVGEVGEGVTGWVAARGEALVVGDAAHDPRALQVPGTEDVDESMLLVPLRYEERVTGVIVLSKLGLHQFGDQDLRLLRIIADQAAVAVENARLLAGRDRLVAEQAALLEISQSGGPMGDERGLATSLARRLAASAACDGCALWRWEADSTVLEPLAEYGTRTRSGPLDLLTHPTTRRVLLERRPASLRADDPDLDPAEMQRLRQGVDEARLLLPLTAGGSVIGLVELSKRAGGFTTDPHRVEYWQTLAGSVGAVLENAHLLDRLRRAADIDQLTGVANHRALQERLLQEVGRAARNHRPLSLAMLDLDGFKAVNDQYGHAAGDGVLREVAAALRAAVRAHDVVARYGGDEFVVLMPDTAPDRAHAVLRRVVAGVRAHQHRLPSGFELTLTASAGLAAFPLDGRTPAELLAAADRAMYASKPVPRHEPTRRNGSFAGPVPLAPAASTGA